MAEALTTAGLCLSVLAGAVVLSVLKKKLLEVAGHPRRNKVTDHMMLEDNNHRRKQV